MDINNETLRLLCERASCRSFLDKVIPEEVLYQVLEAGIHAPSGGNLQPVSIIKVEDSNTRKTLAGLCGNQPWIASAPVNLLFCIDFRRLQRWAELECAPFTCTSAFRHFWISFQDTVVCAQNICTAADSLGLGSVYIGGVLEGFREIRDLVQLPPGVCPVVLLCLGYPKHGLRIQKKLPVEAIVHAETYHEMADGDLVAAFNEKYPDIKVPVTAERLDSIEEVCRTSGGEEFACKCLSKIRERGYINQAQRYFGLHYNAGDLPARNGDYLSQMEESGFDWFKP